MSRKHDRALKLNNAVLAVMEDLIRRHIGEERWAWLQRVIADRKTYLMTAHDWGKIEIALTQELRSFD